MNHYKERQKFFNQHAANWDTESNEEKTQALQKIFRKLHLHLKGWVLDVGCGTGILVPVLLKFLDSQGKIVEFDLSLEMLKQNRNNFSSHRLKILQLNGDAHFLPFASQKFNFLACFAVLPHLSWPHLAYREWYRVLQPAGTLLILHLMSSERLNQFHSQAGQAIQTDHLPPVEVVSSHLQSKGFQIDRSLEKENLYLILARKR